MTKTKRGPRPEFDKAREKARKAKDKFFKEADPEALALSILEEVEARDTPLSEDPKVKAKRERWREKNRKRWEEKGY